MPDVAITPPQYAKRLGIKPSKVLTWIVRGELRAVNVALSTTGRPRWRIPPDAIIAFENQRAAKLVVKPTRRRRKRDASIIEFF